MRVSNPVVPLLFLASATLAAAPADAEPAPARTLMLEVPAAHGSRSPHLSAGDGRLVLSWIEPDGPHHRLRYTVLGDSTWQRPHEVATGQDWFVNWADFPSVFPVDASLWVAHWLVSQPAGGYAYDIHLSFSRDGGETWSEPVLPHDDGTATEHGFVSLFPHGRGVGLVWLDGRDTSTVSHDAGHGGSGMTLRYASYDAGLSRNEDARIDGLVCDCCQTDVAIADAGPVVVYRNRTEDEVRDIYVLRHIDGGWRPPRPVADDGWEIEGCPVNGPSIVADGSEVAVAWFTGVNGRSQVRLARSSDGGATFQTPIEIADGDNFGHAGIAFLPHGRVAVSWLCKRSAGGVSVCLRTVSRGGVVGPVRNVSGDDAVPALTVPQLARHGNELVAAWVAERDGTTILRSARMPYDGAETAD